MAVAVMMPRQGQSVESCILTKWYHAVGDTVAEGDVLFAYETDKASFEEMAPTSGVILAQLFSEWDDVPCLDNVCVIGEAGEDISGFVGETKADDPIQEEASEPVVEDKSDVEKAQPVVTRAEGDVFRISKRAKNKAEQLGIDASLALGSGPKGRVIERDVLALKADGVMFTKAASAGFHSGLETGTALGGKVGVKDLDQSKTVAVNEPSTVVDQGPAYEVVTLAPIRKVIAKTMQTSLNTTAQLTLNTSFDATAILNLRKSFKANEATQNITLNDMVLFAVSRTLKEFKMLNAHYLGDTMHLFKSVHLGIAVDTERGLMVPTLRGANDRSLKDLSENVKSLAAACKGGAINPDLLSGATFTVTNLGTFGIESFTPVLNPPQTGILGVNTITEKVRTVEGALTTYPAMGLSLTFDHSALDGADGARFLQALTAGLEQFSVMMAL